MMDNITIGQYVPGDSWIYKMDPRMKIFLTIMLMAIIFIVPIGLSGLYSMLVLLLLFVLMFLTTKISIIKMLKGLKPILILMMFTFVLQIIYSSNGTLWYTIHFKFGLYPLLSILLILVVLFFTMKKVRFKMIYFLACIFLCFLIQSEKIMGFIHLDAFLNKLNFFSYSLKIYDMGVIRGVFIFLRIVIMISITSLLTFSTMSTDINNGFSSLLTPLKWIKVPVGTIAMMLSLTLRFIPTLVNETNKIMKAQSSRGVDFSESSFKQKVNQIISLLIPMFVISFRRAEELANAMEARGYVIDAPRTRLDVLKLHAVDYITLVLVCFLMAGVILGRIYL